MWRKNVISFIIGVILIAIAFIFSQTTPISREMEQAIRLYREGKDNDAMDRFMDILVKGSPSEKALANDYISKITLRMNTGVSTIEDMQENTPVQNIEKVPLQKQFLQEEKYIEKGVVKEEETGDTKELIASKIRKKIEEMRKEVLMSISKLKPFKVFMNLNNKPVAVLINNDEIFSSATNFKPQALDNLQVLSSLLFTMGNVNIMVIPKGGVTGEIEIANIRRAIAINSYFTSRGISPARLNVNLTGTNIVLPKEVNNVDGTLCLFDYQKEPLLKSDNDPKTQGPRVSLGIYPPAIAVYKNEGAIIEFSVFEGDGGLPTWKFEIYQLLSDNSMLLLQEIHGDGAKYNQTFFNGREKFFGAPYPWGRYLFSVTARDLKGKETTEKRLLFIKPSPEEEKKATAVSQEKGKRISPDKEKVTSEKLVSKAISSKKEKAVSVKPTSKTKNSAKKTAKISPKSSLKNKKDNEKMETANTEEENMGQVVYKIYFEPGTLEITANSQKKLEQVAKTLENYPDTNVLITGYSHKAEENNKVMAKKRADATKKMLVEKYNIDQIRIKSNTKIEAKLKTIAEIKIIQE